MKRIITWFVTNPVATNLLVGFAVVAGFASFTQVPVRTYPDIDLPVVSVVVPYLGAAPEEVERGVCTRIEDHVDGIVGVKEVRTTADEGVCTVLIELLQDADRTKALNDVRNQVGAIETFPAEAETPLVSMAEVSSRVIDVAVTGPTDERTLKQVARRVRADILALPGITQATVNNVRPYEIAVEVSEASLLRNNLTFDEVAAAVSRNSVDLPGGTIRAEQGEVLLRTSGQAYRGDELKKIMVKARPDGSRILLEDVAEVIDGFEETSARFLFDGMPAALVSVSRVGDQDIRQIAEAVRAYVDEFNDAPDAAAGTVGEGVELTVWNDESAMLRDRLGALMDSGVEGLLMVLIILTLFLRPSVALWVSAGIPIALLGAVFLLYALGISINLWSLIGFILVLGMLVDDAVVVGESSHVAQRTAAGQLAGVIDGTERVLLPVTFGVLTTVAAFLPMLYMTGTAGTVLANVGAVVICCLAFSLIECLFVLPAHLAHKSDSLPFGEVGMVLLSIVTLAAFALAPDLRLGMALAVVAVGLVWAAHLWGVLSKVATAFTRLQVRFERGFDRFAEVFFRRIVRAALGRPALTVVTALASLVLAFAVVGSGRLPFSLLTPVHGDRVVASLTMPFGVSAAVTAEAMTRLRDAARRVASRLEQEHGLPLVLHLAESYGSHGGGLGQRTATNPASHLGEVIMQLTPSEGRAETSVDIAAAWRAETGRIDEAVALNFDSALQSAGGDVELRLSGDDMEDLRAMASRLVAEIGQYPGVIEVGDSYLAGKTELSLALTPAGAALGLTLADLGRQVRQAFYGEEAQRVQRGEDDVRVMVRYPEHARRSLASLLSLRIRTADGGEVPFRTVATVEWGQGASRINRTDGARSVSVSAKLDLERTSADRVRAPVQAFLDEAMTAYPNMRYSFQSAKATREALGSAGPLFLLAFFAVFTLLAIPLRSYGQPLIILSVLPFCFVGTVIGHLLMAFIPGAIVSLSLPSLMGMVAAIGVAVNATLVLLHSVNRFLASGNSPIDALENAAVVRCRPILITTATTVAGLTPLMVNTSASIATMRPMVVSLAFGVAIAALAALLFVPALWLVMHRTGTRARQVTAGVGDFVGHAPLLEKWMAHYPYVEESLESQEFQYLMVEDEGLDDETARVARAGLVRLYYRREFDRAAMTEQLAAMARRAPTTEEEVGEVRVWTQQRAFQLAAHMLRSAITPREATGPLTDILDAALATLLDAARRDTVREHGEMPGANVALAALDAAGRRELVAGTPLKLLFLYDCPTPPASVSVTPQEWHAAALQRFLRLLGDLSPRGLLFRAEPPHRLAPAPSAAHAMTDFEALGTAAEWQDLRMLVHARVICADGGLEGRFETVRKAAVGQTRDRAAVAREMATFRSARQGEAWDVGELPGGLSDMALAAEIIQLTHAASAPEVMATGLVATFEAAARRGVVDAATARDLTDATTLWQNFIGFVSMVSSDQRDPTGASPEHQRALADVCGAANIDDLASVVQAKSRRAATRLEELLRH